MGASGWRFGARAHRQIDPGFGRIFSCLTFSGWAQRIAEIKRQIASDHHGDMCWLCKPRAFNVANR